MKKSSKIIYWISTPWLSLGLVSTGIVQIIKTKEEADLFTHLGVPIYLMTLLGIWKLLGAIAVLIPKYPVVKEWAYAGIFFTMTGAIYSHIIMSDGFKELFPPVLMLFLATVSWYFRPPDRKVIPVNHNSVS